MRGKARITTRGDPHSFLDPPCPMTHLVAMWHTQETTVEFTRMQGEWTRAEEVSVCRRTRCRLNTAAGHGLRTAREAMKDFFR
jgi:hypothetical protein